MKKYPEWSLVRYKGKFWWTQWLEDYRGWVDLISVRDRSSGTGAPRDKVREVTGLELAKQCMAIREWHRQGVCWEGGIKVEHIICKGCGKIVRDMSDYWNNWFEFKDKQGELQPYCPRCGKNREDES